MDVKKIKDLAVAVSVIAVAAAVWYAVVRLDSRLAAANQSLSDSADLLDARMEAESARYAGLLASESAKWRAVTDARLAAIQRTTQAEIRETRRALNAQIGGIREDIRPPLNEITARADSVLTEHAELAKELRAQVADLYPDVSAAVQSSTVAARGVAEASEATGKAMPRIAASAEIVASEAAKAAPDARKTIANVERMTRPASWLSRAVRFVVKIFF